MISVKYSIEAIKEAKELFPNNTELHKALDDNSPLAWDIVSKELDKLSRLFHALSKGLFVPPDNS